MAAEDLDQYICYSISNSYAFFLRLIVILRSRLATRECDEITSNRLQLGKWQAGQKVMVDPDKPQLPFYTLDEHLPLYRYLVSLDELFNPIARDIKAMPAKIGEAEDGEVIAIGDAERCGGLYILGKPRTGTSTLLISLALSDIKKGHSILFIDPQSRRAAGRSCRSQPKRP